MTINKTITPEENKKLLALIAEAKARGIKLPSNIEIPKLSKGDEKWNLDEDGYFKKIDGTRFKPRDELIEFINCTARYTLLRSGRGGGKALWVETPILTKNRGWQTMGSLVSGDVVFDEEGNPCNVISKSDVMYGHKCYSVRFSDGSEIIADAEHLWFTQSKKERNREVKSVGKVRTTEQMIENVTIGHRKEKNYSIRTCKPIKYPEANLPLHPYILGQWLGDGNSRSARITTADQETIDKLLSLGVHSKKIQSSIYDYGICFPNTESTRNSKTGRIESNPKNITTILGSMGLIRNKHIPRCYLEASVDQRMSLLQGLMDSDGTVDTRGHSGYTTTVKQLFDDVFELCLSLGIKAGFFTGRATLYGKDCGEAYDIYINTNLPVFRLSRKLNRLIDGKKQAERHEQRFIESITEVGSVPVQCISVDSPSRLFLAGRTLIATHNSVSGIQKGLRKIKEGKSGAVLAPDFEQFKTSTWDELRKWIPWTAVVPKQRYRKSESWEPTKPFTMVFINGARMYCKGLKDPESARGSNINWLMYDEGRRDPTGLGWRNAIAAVRVGDKPQAWCTTTPANSQHWTSTFFNGKLTPEIVKILEEVGAERTQELFKIIQTSIEKNKENLDPMFYASIISSYPSGYLRAREVDGVVADEEGSLGDRQWFNERPDGKRILETLPDWINSQVRFWDLAATEKKMTVQKKKNDPDETMGTLLGTDKPKERFCIEDQIGGAWAWETIKKMVVEVARRDGQEVRICFEQEPASGGKNQVAELISHIKAELPEWDVSGLEAKKLGDRVLAANTWFGEASDGQWYIIKGAYMELFFNQLDYFPNPAIHDDRITSVSGARHKIAPIRKWKKIGFLAIGMAQPEEKDVEKEPEP